MRVSFSLNGRAVTVSAEPRELLLDVLRREGYVGAKRGCDSGDCGVCAVLLDGRPVNSCTLLTPQVQGRAVETVEGLAQGETLHPLQRVFLEEAAVQCGYCTPAMLLVAKALLEREPNPSEAQVREALGGVLCRCTGYVYPVQAVLTAARELQGVSHGR